MNQTQCDMLSKLSTLGVSNVNSTLSLVLNSLNESRLGRHLNCVVETDIESNGPQEDDCDLQH
jgi:hypothetical protein